MCLFMAYKIKNSKIKIVNLPNPPRPNYRRHLRILEWLKQNYVAVIVVLSVVAYYIQEALRSPLFFWNESET